MAVIKCPECGHTVSEHAPKCLSCGVEIAGHLKKCNHCGEFYLDSMSACPHCNHLQSPPNDNKPVQTEPKHKKSGKVWLFAFIFSIIICAITGYFYWNAKSNKEAEAYAYAMQSSDPTVLQSYLDTYKDASQAHRDSITAHLTQIQQSEQEWHNAVASGLKNAIENFIRKYPNSPHKMEAMSKLDSIDWIQAAASGTIEAYKRYLSEHDDGYYVDEANKAILQLQATIVNPEERQAIHTIFRRFFQSINSRNEEGLVNTVSTFLTSFLGKPDATKSDVLTFLHKIYKDDIVKMTWQLLNDYKIDKKEVGDGEYEYTVQFSANQDIERTDANKEKQAKYRVKAKVSPDGKISEFNMVKVLE